MVRSLNRQIKPPVDESGLLKAFDHNWPEFEDAVKKASGAKVQTVVNVDPAALLAEALAYLREQSRELASIKVSLALRSGLDFIGPNKIARAIPDSPESTEKLRKILAGEKIDPLA